MNYSYKISVVIPVYNVEKYIDKCLSSIFSQTMNSSNYEIILLNDGSTDNSGNICKKWEGKYSNISYYEKQNSGVSDTRNLGIKASKGKYILFLDPDDYLSKNVLLDVCTFFDNHYDEIDMVTYPAILFYPSGRKKMHSRYQKDFGKTNQIYDLNEYYYLVQATINICIKNDKKHYFDTNQKYSEDEKFNTEILMEKKKLGYVSNAYYYYRQHSSSVTAKKKDYDFETIYAFHGQLLMQYDNHPYIQSIVMNNMRWRIEEDCLYPQGVSLENRNQYLEKVTAKLQKIDFSLFCNHLSKELLLEIIALSKQKISTKVLTDGTYSLEVNGKKIFSNLTSINEISYLTRKGSKFLVEGRIKTGLYYDKNVEVYANLYHQNQFIKKIKLETKNSLEYQNVISRNYYLEFDSSNVTNVKFELLVDEKESLLEVKNVEWCATHKVIDNYQVLVNKEVIFQKRKFYHRFINKFRIKKPLKFLVINFLSFLWWRGKGANIYFCDENSSLYQEYLKDKSKKIFTNKGTGFQYKIQILNCNTLITDKNIRYVLPFGKMRKNYIEASRFKVVKNGR